MENLYLLENIKDHDLDNIVIDDKSTILVFDYITHNKLSKRKIAHETMDDYLDDEERERIFYFSKSIWTWHEKINESELIFHKINLLSIIDRNELHEFLMDLIPKIHVIKKKLSNKTFKNIYASFTIYQLLENNGIANIKIFGEHKEKTSLTFDNILINYNLGPISIKQKLDRKKYRTIKIFYEKIVSGLFGLTKNFNEKKKIILLEFNPEVYSDLLFEMRKNGFQPVLINFRRPAISSFRSAAILRKTRSMVVIPQMLIDEKEFTKIESYKNNILKKIDAIFMSKNQILSEFFRYDGMRFDHILTELFLNILKERIEEYIIQILVAERMEREKNITDIITLNFSGETEQIFSMINTKYPMILLQHAFSNYTKSISSLIVFDDFHLIKDCIAVYGEIVKKYLTDFKIIPENKIIVCGSPKYDSFMPINKKKENKKIILVTLRPIITHVEGIRIELYDKYEHTINRIIEISHDLQNVEIIFKLHPQQHPHNQIIRQTIEKKDPNIRILQHEPIKKILANCDLHVNIAPDNFDATSVILEAMILRRPTLNIQLQSKTFEFEFMKANAVRTISFDSDIKKQIELLLDEKESQALILNAQTYLKEYLSNHGKASQALVNSL